MPLLSLCAATGCATEVELGETESAVNAYNWSDDTVIQWHYSDRQVGLAYQGGRTYRVNTADDSSQLRYSRFNGSSWSAEQIIPDQFTDKAPALATFDDRVQLVYKEAGANRFRMSHYYGGIWQPPTNAGSSLGLSTITSAPSLTVHDGFLYMGYCRDAGSIDRVQIDRFDGTSWSAVVSYPLSTNSVCKHVAIGSLAGNRFDIVFSADWYTNGTTLDDERMFEITGIGTPISTWVINTLSKRTRRPISIMHCNGRSHLVHGGYATPEGIYWSERGSSGWNADGLIPDQASNGGATLVCHGGTRPLMVHNNTYPAALLYWAEFFE
jgi:hypothetical protein